MTFDDFAYVPVRGAIGGDETVELDGHWFAECRYEGRELIFRGDAPFGFDGNPFIDCRLRLEGRAQKVLSVIGRWFTDEAVLGLVEQLVAVHPSVQ